MFIYIKIGQCSGIHFGLIMVAGAKVFYMTLCGRHVLITNVYVIKSQNRLKMERMASCLYTDNTLDSGMKSLVYLKLIKLTHVK